tara:strand:+ start:1651 stop:2466 length:816 start_codon:yes stop_codon:yes gene_type:complete
MITVHYRPFDALRPVHIAVLAGAEAGLSHQELPDLLGLPELILKQATRDLRDWAMIRIVGDCIELLEQGTRCVSVWVATEQCGFWKFPNPVDWQLGKGLFFFRTPLSRLSDAGFDLETGGFIPRKEAMETQLNYLRDSKRLEQEIRDEIPSNHIAKCSGSGKDPEEMITAFLSRPKNRLHLNQLCRLLEAAIDENRPEDAGKNDWQRRAQKKMANERKKAEQRLRYEQRAMQPVKEVLMAKWLSEQAGLLLDLSKAEPCSILIRSESEAVI